MTKRFSKDDIEFHSDGMGRTAHAAVNVKVYGSFRDVDLSQFTTEPGFDRDYLEASPKAS